MNEEDRKKEMIKKKIDRAMIVKKFYTEQQLDAVQNMMTQFYQKGYLSEKQNSYLSAIIRTGEHFLDFEMRQGNE